MADYLWKMRTKINSFSSCKWFDCATNGGCFDTTDVDTNSAEAECIGLEPNVDLQELDGPYAGQTYSTVKDATDIATKLIYKADTSIW